MVTFSWALPEWRPYTANFRQNVLLLCNSWNTLAKYMQKCLHCSLYISDTCSHEHLHLSCGTILFSDHISPSINIQTPDISVTTYFLILSACLSPSLPQGLAAPWTIFLRWCLFSTFLTSSVNDNPVHDFTFVHPCHLRSTSSTGETGVVPRIIPFSRQSPCSPILLCPFTHSQIFTSLVNSPQLFPQPDESVALVKQTLLDALTSMSTDKTIAKEKF